jgi:hypothetical protein
VVSDLTGGELWCFGGIAECRWRMDVVRIKIPSISGSEKEMLMLLRGDFRPSPSTIEGSRFRLH